MTMRWLAFLWSCAVWPLSADVALAQREPSTTLEARERFERGLTLVNEGDLSGSLAEFQRAQELYPTGITLYNLGLVYAALHRPVDAVRALEQAKLQASTLKSEYQVRLQRTLDEQTRRIGRVALSCNLQQGSVHVDNVEVARLPLQAPLEIAGGLHVIGVVAQAHAPARKEVLVPEGGEVSVELALTPIDARLAHIVVRTQLPAAHVYVDGGLVGLTPLEASVTVVPGPHEVEVRRAGYTSPSRQIELQDGSTAELTFSPQIDPGARTGEGGTLAVSASEDGASAIIDGALVGAVGAPLSLPRGPHRVRVERGGFLPAERDVEIALARTTTLRVALEPTPETRAAYVDAATSRRTWSIAVLAVGGVVAAGGLTLAIVETSALRDARRELAVVESEWQSGACGGKGTEDATCDARLNEAANRVDHLEVGRTLGFIAAGVGAATALLGAALWITGDDPHRYDAQPRDTATSLSVGAMPTGILVRQTF